MSVANVTPTGEILCAEILTFDVVGELAVDALVRFQRLLVVTTATMTAGDHQLPANLSRPALNSIAAQCNAPQCYQCNAL